MHFFHPLAIALMLPFALVIAVLAGELAPIVNFALTLALGIGGGFLSVRLWERRESSLG